MRYLKSMIAALFAASASISASAQFYTTGDTSPAVKWNQIETDNYRFIYPAGTDSLARVYARKFELNRPRVGMSTGVLPNGTYKSKFPVVLHNDRAYSNGVVVWAPQRLEIYTNPDPYASDPMPWIDELSLHENRHISQMQFANMGKLRPLNYVIGEMWAGLCAGLFLYTDWLEGDAVVAETALSRSGRGRTADFLNYYMIAFDQGDWRSWWRWACGSQNLHTLNEYTLGYMYYSGLRYKYNMPSISGAYIDRMSRKPWQVLTYRDNISKEISGLNATKIFYPIAEETYKIWKANADARNPVTVGEAMVKMPKRYASYQGSAMTADGTLYSFRESMDRVRSLVKISPDGKETILSTANPQTSNLRYDEQTGRLYWSETVPDARWSRQSNSNIYYLGPDGTKERVAKGKYFNPSPDGDRLSVTEYPITGGSRIVILDAFGGNEIGHYTAPDGVQVEQTAFCDGVLYATVITDDGYGLMHIENGRWKTDLASQPVMVKDLFPKDGKLWFTCDRNGNEELYSYSPTDGKLLQHTSTRYGASAFQFSPDGSELTYSLALYEGKLPYRTAASTLLAREVQFSDIYSYPIADAISRQEAQMESVAAAFNEEDISISDPVHYNKLKGGLNMHSWAPAYVNPERLMDFNLDPLYKTLAFGVTGISQNVLGNSIMSAGYSFHKDSFDQEKWRHSGHLNWTYTGWYPVIKASVDFGDRSALKQSFLLKTTDNKSYSIGIQNETLDKPYLDVNVSASIPLRFSAHGHYGGLTPRVAISFDNDALAREAIGINTETGEEKVVRKYNASDFSFNHGLTTTAGFNAYVLQNTAPSAVYPRFGIVAEAGIFAPVSPLMLNSGAYATTYGYLPGFGTQGLRLAASYQYLTGNSFEFNTASLLRNLPRGFDDNAKLYSAITQVFTHSTKFSADYAIPFSFGDIDLAEGMLYIKRFVLTPHFDYSIYATAPGKARSWGSTGNLWSAGASLGIDLGSILQLMFPITLGVDASYNGGSLFGVMDSTYNIPVNRFYITPVFDIAF